MYNIEKSPSKLKMANTLSLLTNSIRNAVSKQRIRYTENGYNLDLTHIRDNLIAMGYPADNYEGIYRNRLEDVYKYLEESYKNRYKIYNLCSERSYDTSKFHGRVAQFPFADHNPPTIELIQTFCDDVDSWLKENEGNVAAVHCKAGKGRTGTMICCYLLHCGFAETAEQALEFYDEKRTKDRKGVTIPSQRRYVDYYSKLKSSGKPYEKRALQLCEIKFSSAPLVHSQGTANCIITALHDISGDSRQLSIDFRKTLKLEINDLYQLTGDVKIELSYKIMKSTKSYFHFWFNTYFVSEYADCYNDNGSMKLICNFKKHDLDDAHKDKEHKNFTEDFTVQLVFKIIDENVISQMKHHQIKQNLNRNNYFNNTTAAMNGTCGYIEKDENYSNNHQYINRQQKLTPNHDKRQQYPLPFSTGASASTSSMSQENHNNSSRNILYSSSRNDLISIKQPPSINKTSTTNDFPITKNHNKLHNKKNLKPTTTITSSSTAVATTTYIDNISVPNSSSSSISSVTTTTSEDDAGGGEDWESGEFLLLNNKNFIKTNDSDSSSLKNQQELINKNNSNNNSDIIISFSINNNNFISNDKKNNENIDFNICSNINSRCSNSNYNSRSNSSKSSYNNSNESIISTNTTKTIPAKAKNLMKYENENSLTTTTTNNDNKMLSNDYQETTYDNIDEFKFSQNGGNIINNINSSKKKTLFSSSNKDSKRILKNLSKSPKTLKQKFKAKTNFLNTVSNNRKLHLNLNTNVTNDVNIVPSICAGCSGNSDKSICKIKSKTTNNNKKLHWLPTYFRRKKSSADSIKFSPKEFYNNVNLVLLSHQDLTKSSNRMIKDIPLNKTENNLSENNLLKKTLCLSQIDNKILHNKNENSIQNQRVKKLSESYDYYSSFCDRQLSFSSSPCKSPPKIPTILINSKTLDLVTEISFQKNENETNALKKMEISNKYDMTAESSDITTKLICAKPLIESKIGFFQKDDDKIIEVTSELLPVIDEKKYEIDYVNLSIDTSANDLNLVCKRLNNLNTNDIAETENKKFDENNISTINIVNEITLPSFNYNGSKKNY